MIACVSVHGRISFVLCLGLLMTGCASVSRTEISSVALRSYDLPVNLDSNAVLHAVKSSFSQVLESAPRIIEGSVPSPLPAMPAHFAVEHRRVYLDRLGVVDVPQVVCPESIALLYGLAAPTQERPNLHTYAGCIQLYAGGYRVHIVASTLGSEDQESLMSRLGTGSKPGNSDEDIVLRIAQALVGQISEARLVDASHSQGVMVHVTQPPVAASRPPASASRVEARSSSNLLKESTVGGSEPREEGALPGSPWVCLAPRRESITVRSQPGGEVVGMLHSGSVLTAAEPVQLSYFRIETEEGPIGWVSRADVKRLPCPIG